MWHHGTLLDYYTSCIFLFIFQIEIPWKILVHIINVIHDIIQIILSDSYFNNRLIWYFANFLMYNKKEMEILIEWSFEK